MSMETNHPASQPTDLEVINTRLIAAPRDLVFEVFSTPEHLTHWWGPNDFTNSFQRFEFRPGGKWQFIMHGPDGAQYPQNKEFVEIIPPSCIVLRHIQEMHDFDMAMTFAEHGDSTEVTWRMVFAPSPNNANLAPIVTAANEQNFDRLEAYLKVLQNGIDNNP